MTHPDSACLLCIPHLQGEFAWLHASFVCSDGKTVVRHAEEQRNLRDKPMRCHCSCVTAAHVWSSAGEVWCEVSGAHVGPGR